MRPDSALRHIWSWNTESQKTIKIHVFLFRQALHIHIWSRYEVKPNIVTNKLFFVKAGFPYLIQERKISKNISAVIGKAFHIPNTQHLGHSFFRTFKMIVFFTEECVWILIRITLLQPVSLPCPYISVIHNKTIVSSSNNSLFHLKGHNLIICYHSQGIISEFEINNKQLCNVAYSTKLVSRSIYKLSLPNHCNSLHIKKV